MRGCIFLKNYKEKLVINKIDRLNEFGWDCKFFEGRNDIGFYFV